MKSAEYEPSELLTGLRQCLRHVLANPDDIEALHAMRVATRGILAHLDKDSSAFEQLKTLINLSNDLRDQDVFLSKGIHRLPEKFLPNVEDGIRYVQYLRGEKMREFLPQLQTIHAQWGTWSSCIEKALANAIAADKSIEPSGTIFEVRIQLKKARKRLKKPMPKERAVHKLRIRLKKARYLLNHLQPDHPSNKSLKKLQALLGEHHDITQMKRMLFHSLPVAHTGHFEEVRQTLNAQQEKLWRKAGKVMDKSI